MTGTCVPCPAPQISARRPAPLVPAYVAVRGGQVIRGGDAHAELREGKTVPQGEERAGGWQGTGDSGGWGLTGWPGRAGRTLLLSLALVKPDCSMAPMVIFCRRSGGSNGAGRGDTGHGTSNTPKSSWGWSWTRDHQHPQPLLGMERDLGLWTPPKQYLAELGQCPVSWLLWGVLGGTPCAGDCPPQGGEGRGHTLGGTRSLAGRHAGAGGSGRRGPRGA